jgi:hypothetical protein
MVHVQESLSNMKQQAGHYPVTTSGVAHSLILIKQQRLIGSNCRGNPGQALPRKRSGTNRDSHIVPNRRSVKFVDENLLKKPSDGVFQGTGRRNSGYWRDSEADADQNCKGNRQSSRGSVPGGQGQSTCLHWYFATPELLEIERQVLRDR